MTISNHYLVPADRIRSVSDRKLHSLLEYVLSVNYVGGSEKQNNLLVLLYICKYISAEELTYLLGLPESSYKSLHVLLNYMEQKKLIKKYELPKKDSCSRAFYYLTQDGFHAAASLFDNGVYEEYKRRGKDSAVMHDYSVGMNALHLILFQKPFTYLKELSFGVSKKTGRDTSKTLRVDSICVFSNSPTRLYFEQDLGNESDGILLDKLSKYQSNGHMEHVDAESIIFSFRKPYCVAEPPVNPVYSPSNLKKLYGHMVEHGFSSLRQLIDSYDSDSFSLVNHKDVESVLSCAYDVAKCVGMCSSDGVFEKNADLSLSMVQEFYSEVSELRSDYRNRDLNFAQNQFATYKFRVLTGLLLSKYRQRETYTEPYISDMMRGYSVWAVPTTLLINYLPFICLNESGYYKVLEESLKRLHPSFRFSEFSMENRLIKQEGFPCTLNLRNIFIYQKGFVSIEYVSRDMGGLLRAVRFRENYLSVSTNITLLCLVDSYKDALFLTREAYLDCDDIKFTSSSRIFFILRQELPKITPFRIVNGKRKNEPDAFSSIF